MRSRFGVIFAAGMLMSSGVAFGQTTSSAPVASAPQTAPGNVTFDVASVRPAPPLDMAKLQADMQAGKMPRFGPHVDASRAEYTYMSLKELIANAYKLKAYQITGPDWLNAQRFNIVATLPNGASKDDAPTMLQALLEERFKLKVHRDSQEHPVLGLVVAKGGPKLKESPGDAPAIDPDAPLKAGEMKVDGPDGPMRVMRNKDGSTTINMGAKGVMTQRMDMQAKTLNLESSKLTMDGFADQLTNVMQMGGGGRQVVNMTDLKGDYQVAVEISLAGLIAMAQAQGVNVPGGGGGAAAASGTEAVDPGGGGSTVYSSVEKLGLKLEPRKAKVEQLIVDSAEKIPTEN
jgi:uncharacterized protein (TIGR03435 family)